MIKLVAIDLDGTLLNSQKQVSKENKEAILAAKEQGVKMVLCSGRPLLSVIPLLDELGLRDEGDYSVTLNGGLIQKNDDGTVLSEIIMAQDAAADLHQLTSTIDISLDAITSTHVYHVLPNIEKQPSYYNQLNKLLQFERRNVADFHSKIKVNKFVCANEDPEHITASLAKVPASYRNKYNVVRSGEYLFEFVDKKVSKGAGLSQLGQKLNIAPHEMMALGDEENDLSMIGFVGLGVAMDNATAEVKKIAKFVTKTNDDHGVAHAIQKFVLNG